jgi:hypothetical protein
VTAIASWTVRVPPFLSNSDTVTLSIPLG